MKSNKYFLVYKIVNKKNGKIYIGAHVTDDINDKYMGSGTEIRKAIKEEGMDNFEKIILYQFNNINDMLKKERELVNNEFIKRNNTYNVILGGSFNTSGTVTVKDIDGNTFQVHKNDPRYLNGELIHIAKGTVSVRDNNGNYYRVNQNDNRYLSGELIPITKGMVLVRDKNGNCFQANQNDNRYLSGELIPITKGMVTVKDKNGNYFQVHKNDPRYLNRELVSIWKERKHSDHTKQKISETKQKNKSQQGKKNSQYGTCWITNGTENKKIKKDDLEEYIKNNWKKGRVIKN